MQKLAARRERVAAGRNRVLPTDTSVGSQCHELAATRPLEGFAGNLLRLSLCVVDGARTSGPWPVNRPAPVVRGQPSFGLV